MNLRNFVRSVKGLLSARDKILEEDIGAGVPDLPKPQVTGGLSAPANLKITKSDDPDEK